jgi:hypothetical protein
MNRCVVFENACLHLAGITSITIPTIEHDPRDIRNLNYLPCSSYKRSNVSRGSHSIYWSSSFCRENTVAGNYHQNFFLKNIFYSFIRDYKGFEIRVSLITFKLGFVLKIENQMFTRSMFILHFHSLRFSALRSIFHIAKIMQPLLKEL